MEIFDGGDEFAAWHRWQADTTDEMWCDSARFNVRKLKKRKKVQFTIEEKLNKWKCMFVYVCDVYMTLNSYKSWVEPPCVRGRAIILSEEVMLLSLLSGCRILFVTFVTYMRTMMILMPSLQLLLLLFLSPLQNVFSTRPTRKLWLHWICLRFELNKILTVLLSIFAS